MTAALAFLTSRWGFAAIGGALLVLVYGAWSIQVADLRSTHATAISAEQQKTRDVEKQWGDYKLQVEQTISNNAREARDALRAQLDRNEELNATTERLRAANSAAFRERDRLSAELLRRLNNAPKTPESFLDGPGIAYYRSLREQQLAARSGRGAPAGGNPN